MIDIEYAAAKFKATELRNLKPGDRFLRPGFKSAGEYVVVQKPPIHGSGIRLETYGYGHKVAVLHVATGELRALDGIVTVEPVVGPEDKPADQVEIRDLASGDWFVSLDGTPGAFIATNDCNEYHRLCVHVASGTIDFVATRKVVVRVAVKANVTAPRGARLEAP